jgi:hypothetical protein
MPRVEVDEEEIEALSLLYVAVKARGLQTDTEQGLIALIDAIRARAKQAEVISRLAPYLECGRCRYRGDETITDPDCPLHGTRAERE